MAEFDDLHRKVTFIQKSKKLVNLGENTRILRIPGSSQNPPYPPEILLKIQCCQSHVPESPWPNRQTRDLGVRNDLHGLLPSTPRIRRFH